MPTLGSFNVSAVGLGAAGFSVGDPPDETTSRDTIRAAVDSGMTIMDTAACYVPRHDQPGHNEAVLRNGLDGVDGEVVVITKAGIRRTASGGSIATDFTADASPDAVRDQCRTSLAALGVDHLDVLQLHAPDPDVPLVETVGAMAELRAEGKVRHVGLCNVDVEQLDLARSVVEIVSVQHRLSFSDTTNLALVDACAERDVTFIAYSPLGGLGAPARAIAERPVLADVADELGVSPHRVALAWLLHLGDHVVAIPGCRRPATARDSATARDLRLDPDQRARLDLAAGLR